MCATASAFDHSPIAKRLLAITCVFCNTQYWTPKRKVMRIVERVHNCPKMLRAMGRKSK